MVPPRTRGIVKQGRGDSETALAVQETPDAKVKVAVAEHGLCNLARRSSG
jgi:hypothetical protein